MFNKMIPLLFVLIFLPNLLYAQKIEYNNLSESALEEYSIDAKLDKCLDDDYSVQAMIICLNEAYDDWDTALNQYYRLLIKQLDYTAQIELRDAQKAWINYREIEFAFMDNLYGQIDGSMYRVIAIGDKVDFVKRRTLELKAYYEIVTEP